MRENTANTHIPLIAFTPTHEIIEASIHSKCRFSKPEEETKIVCENLILCNIIS